MRGVFRYLGCWERVGRDADEETPDTVVREVQNAVEAYESVHGGTPHRQAFDVEYDDSIYRARVDRDGETRYYRAPDASAVRRTVLGFGRLVGDVADSIERLREDPAAVTARTTVFSAFAFLLVVAVVGAMGFGFGTSGGNVSNATEADGVVANVSAEVLDDSLVFNEVRAERLVFDEANEVRREHGVGETERVGALSEYATVHAGNMAKNEYVGHVTPAGENVGDRYGGACEEPRYNTREYSENAAAVAFDEPLDGWNSTELDTEEDVAEFVVKAWLDSPDHRESLLESDRDGMGIGVRLHEGKVFVVQALCGPPSD
jgi:hypothetical protein